MNKEKKNIGTALRNIFLLIPLIGLSRHAEPSGFSDASLSPRTQEETRSYHPSPRPSERSCENDCLSWGSFDGFDMSPAVFGQHADPMNMLNLDSPVEKSKSNLWVPQYLPAVEVKSEPASPVAQALPKSSFKKIGNDPETRRFIDWFHHKYCNVAENKKAENLRQDLFSSGTHDAAKRDAVVHKMKDLDNIVNLLLARHISPRNANAQISMLREESAELLAGVKLCELK